jgi:hypothetical protein
VTAKKIPQKVDITLKNSEVAIGMKGWHLIWNADWAGGGNMRQQFM